MDYHIYVINVMNPDNTLTTYAFMGDTLLSKEEFLSKRDNYLSKLKQHLTVNEDIWKFHSSSEFKHIIMIQDHIFLEDTIQTIKLKLFQALQRKDLGIEDIYLYTETQQNLNLKHIYQILTHHKRETLTKDIMDEFLLNYDCITHPIADKETYTYDEFINDPNIRNACGFTTPLGYNHLHYLFTVNPFKVFNYDTNRLLKKDVAYYPNQLLLEVGQFKSNVIYACLSDTVLVNHKDKGIDIGSTLKLYFPQLYKLQYTSIEQVTLAKHDRYDSSVTNYATLEPQYKHLNVIQDIYTTHKDVLNYSNSGLRELAFMYHPNITFDIPIHLIFKIIHSSDIMPMVKYNPGKKQENLYRLFTGDQIATNGRKVPILSRHNILQLIKLHNNHNTVTCYCVHDEYTLTFEFNSIGEIIIRYNSELNIQKQPILKSIQFIDNVVRTKLNSIIHVINSVITESGIQYIPIESVFYNPYLKVLNIVNEYQVSIVNDIDLTPYINCLSSFLIVQNPLLKNGIKTVFKRVPNYNTHTNKERLILTLIHEKKSVREIKHLLTKNFNLTIHQAEDEINACIQNVQTDVSAFGKQKMVLKDHPGINIHIDRKNLSFQTNIVITNISHMDYLFILDKYIATLLYLTQDYAIPKHLICPEELNETIQEISPVVEESRVIGKTKPSITDLLYDDDDDDDDIDVTKLDSIDEDESMDEEEELVLFSYGSNNKEQLMERINRSNLTIQKGYIENYETIFGGYSEKWNGSVASIIEKDGEMVKGTYLSVTDIELTALDNFETSYERQMVTVKTESNEEIQAVAYIKIDTEWDEHPSTEYLNACYKTIEPYWDDTTIVVKNNQSQIMGNYDATTNTYSKNTEPPPVEALAADQVKFASSSDEDAGEADAGEADAVEAVAVDQVNFASSSSSEKDAVEAVAADQVNFASSSDSEKDAVEAVAVDQVNFASSSDEDAGEAVAADQVNFASSSDSEEEDSEDEEASLTTNQKGGLNKVKWEGEKLNNPTPFASYMRELEPNMYLSKKGEKYNKYSSACPSNLKRQPVILTEEEYQALIKSDPEYTLITKDNFDAIRNMDAKQQGKLVLQYGSDPKKMFYYICPRYWCLSENRPLTQEQVDNNECGGNVIEKGTKKVPANTFIYSFKSTYNKDHKTGLNTVPMYPGFLKQDVHPDGFCLPCCMKGILSDKYLTRLKSCGQSGLAQESEDPINKGAQMRVLGPDKFPLDSTKLGYLTLSLESFLNIKSTEFQSKVTVKFNHKCILRRGVEKGKDKKDSFLGCIAAAYASFSKTTIMKIDKFRQFLSDSLELDQFVQYHNANLVSIFYKKNARHTHTLPESQTNAQILTLDIPKTTLDKLIISYNAYKVFIKSQTALTYEYLWDYICDLLDCNLIIIHKSNEDITDRMEIICPSNAYSDISYSSSKKSLVLYEENGNFEPIIEYTLYDAANAKKYKTKIVIQYFFQEKGTHKHMIKLLKDTKQIYNHHCKPVKSTEELVFTPNILASQMRTHLLAHRYTIDYDIIDYHLKIVGMMVSHGGMRTIVPTYPSNIELGKPVRFIEHEYNWVSYEESRDFLTKIYASTKTSKHPIPCNPVSKIIDDTDRIIGIFTMTGQFIQVDPIKLSDVSNDNLISIYSQHNYNEEDKVFYEDKQGDVSRETFVRNIKLEQGFYISFRNTLKWLLSNQTFYPAKLQIQELIQQKSGYVDKLEKMQVLLKSIMSNYVVFTSMKSTNHLKQIELCCNKSVKNDCKGTGAFCIYSDSEQTCKLHIPKENLQHNKDNEEIYYIRLSDELIRYIHYQQYILNINNNNIVKDLDYRINDNEIIILESTLLSNYFKHLKPISVSKYNINATYDTIQPLETIEYDLNYQEEVVDQSNLEEKQQDLDNTNAVDAPMVAAENKSCIKETKDVTNYFKTNIFKLNNVKEDFYHDSISENCVFALIVAICKVMQVPIFVKKYTDKHKTLFITQYKSTIIRYLNKFIIQDTTELQATHNKNKQLSKIFKTQGKITIAKELGKNITNLPLFILQPNYNWSNLDLWIIATHEKLPIILINKSEFLELNHIKDANITVKKILLLYYNPTITEFLLVRQEKKTENHKTFSYTFLHTRGNYLFNESTIPGDSTIATAIKQYIPIHKWFNTFI